MPVHAAPADIGPGEPFPSGRFEITGHRFPSFGRPQHRARRPADGALLRAAYRGRPRRALGSAMGFLPKERLAPSNLLAPAPEPSLARERSASPKWPFPANATHHRTSRTRL